MARMMLRLSLITDPTGLFVLNGESETEVGGVGRVEDLGGGTVTKGGNAFFARYAPEKVPSIKRTAPGPAPKR